MLRHLDLFSGIGGFALAARMVGGYETVAFCEIEPYCQAVLRKHYPGVPIFNDVRQLAASDVPRIDVITGGFPCQDISAAGARIGIEGARSGLWKEYARLVSEIRPQFVLVENVADLLTRGLGVVLGDLVAIGYDAEWHCLPAYAVGADHERDRCWIVAYPNGSGPLALQQLGREPRAEEVGTHAADNNRTRLPRRLQTGALDEDARNLSARIGLAFCAASPFPGLDGAGSPVLGRGEDGIPHRVDRMHAIGNAIVPQCAAIFLQAIKECEEARSKVGCEAGSSKLKDSTLGTMSK